MKYPNRTLTLAIAGVSLLLVRVDSVHSADWPQWRGLHRDANAVGFTAPAAWPDKLNQKWKTQVGNGDSTPALVGDRLYVFARQGGSEVTVCLNASTGAEIWRDAYDAQAATGPAGRHPGPRSSPAVAGGKAVTLGVSGTVSCVDAVTGNVLWRNNDYRGAVPRFFTSSSPLIVGNLAIAQVGGSNNGGIVAFDLASGDKKWAWTGDGPAYASPALLTVGDVRSVVAQTDAKMVALDLADGKVLWQTPFAVSGRGYNTATPIIHGQTIIYGGSGRGTTAVKLEKSANGLEGRELWSNPDNSVQYNTPVLNNGYLFGLSQRGDFFCINAETGKTTWTQSSGGRNAFGSIVNAGTVLLGLTPNSELIVFEPNPDAYKELARIKVADSEVYSYPIATGNGIYVKDQNSVALLTLN